MAEAEAYRVLGPVSTHKWMSLCTGVSASPLVVVLGPGNPDCVGFLVGGARA